MEVRKSQACETVNNVRSLLSVVDKCCCQGEEVQLNEYHQQGLAIILEKIEKELIKLK